MKEICAAMAKAFAEIEGVVKDKDNPFFKSKYADLSSIVNAVKPVFIKYGLFFVQKVLPSEGETVVASVETIIYHLSGEFISCGATSCPVGKVDKATGKLVGADAQAYGAALTYARRFGLSAACGIAPEDDDGNEASGHKIELKKKTDLPLPMSTGPLSDVEMQSLAYYVIERIGDLARIIDKEMIDYLRHLERNSKEDIRARVEKGLKDKGVFVDYFVRWRKSGLKKPVEAKEAVA